MTKHDPLPQPIATKRDQHLSFCRCMIAANAIRRYREDGEDGRVSYSRNKNYYQDPNRQFYWLPWFSYAYIISAVDQMEAAGLLIHDRKKRGNRHWQSWFRATQKLMNFKTEMKYRPKHRVILRNKEKNEIAYNERARLVIKMIRDIDAINAYLARQTITLGDAVLKEGDPLFVDLHCISGALRISTRRIFHDGSFGLGGRWYNDLQNIPRAARNRLRLNGQPVAIHDYSAFYPGLLYAMVGAECDGDPYTIPDWPREVSKPTLNILINAKNQTAAVRATAKKLKELGDNASQKDRHTKARAIIGILKKRNAPIARYFNSDIGKRLPERRYQHSSGDHYHRPRRFALRNKQRIIVAQRLPAQIRQPIGALRRLRLCRMYAGHAPARKKSREHGTTPGEAGYEASTRKPYVKARSPSACGLIPSIRSGSKYTNLSSALR